MKIVPAKKKKIVTIWKKTQNTKMRKKTLLTPIWAEAKKWSFLTPPQNGPFFLGSKIKNFENKLSKNEGPKVGKNSRIFQKKRFFSKKRRSFLI